MFLLKIGLIWDLKKIDFNKIVSQFGNDNYISLNHNDSSMARKRPSGGALANGTCQISETQAKLARCASLCIKQVANILRPELGAPLPSNFEQYVRSIQNILAPRIG